MVIIFVRNSAICGIFFPVRILRNGKSSLKFLQILWKFFSASWHFRGQITWLRKQGTIVLMFWVACQLAFLSKLRSTWVVTDVCKTCILEHLQTFIQIFVLVVKLSIIVSWKHLIFQQLTTYKLTIILKNKILNYTFVQW